MNKTLYLAFFGALLLLAPAGTGQSQLVLDQVHGFSLEETVTGENPDRTVAVYLPPSYPDSPERRYPVLYLLHGIGGTHDDWVRPANTGQPWQTLQDVMDRGIAAGRIAEIVIVAGDQRTRGGGSFYTNSEVTGAWENFTVVDLVDYVDSTYRTLSEARSRGVAGHSMGGFGAIKLGMRHPDVYQVIYGLNSAVMGFAADLTGENPAFERAARADPAQLNPRVDFWVPSILCVAQALSPNRDAPPFYADLPFLQVDGELTETPALERWKQEMPLYMVDEYQDNLRSLRALRFDSGRYDGFTHIPVTNLALSERLTELEIEHVFEDYNGDHMSELWGEEGRMATEVLPFFSRQLQFE